MNELTQNERELLNELKKNVEFETTIKQKLFKHKISGEIKKQVSILELNDYIEV